MTAEDELWAEWTARYASRRGELTRDGAGPGYFGSVPRVVVVLKEPNNSPGFDTREFLINGPRWPIWHTLATWLVGVFEGFPPYTRVRADENAKKKALGRIAVMNLKKLSGGAATAESVLHRYAFLDRDLLRKQFALLSPDLILACGTFDPVVWLLDEEIAHDVDLAADVVPVGGARRLVRFRHPARSRGERDYVDLQRTWPRS